MNCSFIVSATQVSDDQANSYQDDVLGISFEEFKDAVGDPEARSDIAAGLSAMIIAVKDVFRFRYERMCRSVAGPMVLRCRCHLLVVSRPSYPSLVPLLAHPRTLSPSPAAARQRHYPAE